MQMSRVQIQGRSLLSHRPLVRSRTRTVAVQISVAQNKEAAAFDRVEVVMDRGGAGTMSELLGVHHHHQHAPKIMSTRLDAFEVNVLN